jgi:hypothetical protein
MSGLVSATCPYHPKPIGGARLRSWGAHLARRAMRPDLLRCRFFVLNDEELQAGTFSKCNEVMGRGFLRMRGKTMPIIWWLFVIPFTVSLLLMALGVIRF